MKVRIESDGSSVGTRILNEDGSSIAGVVTVSFEHTARRDPQIRLELCIVSYVIEGEAKVYGPDGKQIKKMIFADGSEIEY